MKIKPFLLLTLILVLAFGLRFYNLSQNPPSPYWEEVALGYDAYSILKTGRDFHGNPWPIVAFESFGDWKPSLYFYATVPAIALLGLKVLAVRLPSALAGVATVALIYFLTKEVLSLLQKGKSRNLQELVALGTALLLAISPWHLQVSRVGFETNLGLFLLVLGSYLFFRSLTHPRWLLGASIAWALSMYAYHAERVFVPLWIGFLGLWFLKKLLLKKWLTFLAVFLFLVLIGPILLSLNNPKFTQRFQETSALASLDPILASNRLIEEDGGTAWARLVHHRFWHYGKLLASHYLDHFDFDYLFLTGDSNPRHSIQLVGNLFLIQLPFLLLAFFFVFKNKAWGLLPIVVWLFLAPVPAALTKATPHALRSLPMVIPLSILTVYGLVEFVKVISSKKLLVVGGWLLVGGILSIELVRYLFIYYTDYPRDYSSHWQHGYEAMVQYVSQNQENYDQIYITRDQGRPSMFYWFYTQTDPRKVQELNNQVSKDQGEYLQFGKIFFGEFEERNLSAKTLVVAAQEKDNFGKKLTTINNLDGEKTFVIYEFDKKD